MHKYLRLTVLYMLLGILLCSLSACAFKLRNRNELPPQLHVLYLKADDPYGAFESNLRASLQSSGIMLSDTAAEAPVTLHVLKPQLTYAAGTIGTSNQTRIYAVTYKVAMILEDADGKQLLSPMLLSDTRNLVLSANQLIRSNNQLSKLEQEMYRDIISQLFNRLSSVQVAEVLQKT
ncbi:MAG TPA: LPS assembly lipoprotein LptE [Gammaproteobacteria bacterium]|nr:LPS assembly lipoprotein LptE [Gammaproteobacteria bacterium]